MGELESTIQASYNRLNVGGAVYLLRGYQPTYEELPNPEVVEQVFKADVIQVDQTGYRQGVSLSTWPFMQRRPRPAELGPMFAVSPREVFTLEEINTTIKDRTPLTIPRPSKLDRYIDSENGRFGKILAAAMAHIIIERFSEDPRDSTGRLIKR